VQSVIVSKGTYTLPDGTHKETNSKSETLVTQLELRSLDAGLFEIPARFKHVRQIERNPRVSASSNQRFWERFKAKVAGFLNP
jgi:hypothetical protein